MKMKNLFGVSANDLRKIVDALRKQVATLMADLAVAQARIAKLEAELLAVKDKPRVDG